MGKGPKEFLIWEDFKLFLIKVALFSQVSIEDFRKGINLHKNRIAFKQSIRILLFVSMI